MSIKKAASALFLLMMCSVVFAVQLTSEQQAAKERGIMLYNQYKAVSAEPYLKIAAEAGDREAQYYLGESLRLNKRYMTKEAHKWYVAAASQGDYYAMYRLSGKGSDLCSVMGNCAPDTKSPGDWLMLGRETAKALAEKGDSEAMFVLFYLTNEFEWMEKAAEAGYPEAQFDLANLYIDGRYFFFPPWNRSEKVEELLEKSAKGGFVKAMGQYQEYLYKRNDIAGIRYWTKKAVEAGDANSIYGYGSFLSHEPEDYGFPLDLVKGYGFIYLLQELDGGGNLRDMVGDTLQDIAAKMTPEQIEQGKAFAEQWKATHPPLSYFPSKLGF
jgi:uncharacterized protein